MHDRKFGVTCSMYVTSQGRAPVVIVLLQLAPIYYTSLRIKVSLSSSYLSRLFAAPSTHHNTRASSTNQLNLPLTSSSFGKKAFSFAGALAWPSLPSNVRVCRDYPTFCKLCSAWPISFAWILYLYEPWIHSSAPFACLDDPIFLISFTFISFIYSFHFYFFLIQHMTDSLNSVFFPFIYLIPPLFSLLWVPSE